jgi:hypothetical protein
MTHSRREEVLKAVSDHTVPYTCDGKLLSIQGLRLA